MLAELLADKGLKALGEVILKKPGRRPEPDILVVINGVRIVIEGKKPGKWNELVVQCQDRLDNNICDICIMVEYTELPIEKVVPTQSDIKYAILRGKFNVGIISIIDRAGLVKWMPTRASPERYDGIGFEDLLTYLMSGYSHLVKEDIVSPVVAKINEVLQSFSSSIVQSTDVNRLKEVLELAEKEEN